MSTPDPVGAAAAVLAEHRPKALNVDVLGCHGCDWSDSMPETKSWRLAHAAHQADVLREAGVLALSDAATVGEWAVSGDNLAMSDDLVARHDWPGLRLARGRALSDAEPRDACERCGRSIPESLRHCERCASALRDDGPEWGAWRTWCDRDRPYLLTDDENRARYTYANLSGRGARLTFRPSPAAKWQTVAESVPLVGPDDEPREDGAR